LKDQSAVQNAEKVLREFKAVDYDLSKWNGVVDAFEGKAVAAAKETLAKISKEEGSLKETLSNIQEARPFEDLTVSLVISARQGGARQVCLRVSSVRQRSVDCLLSVPIALHLTSDALSCTFVPN
jgi:F-type H+-transporting ATPase subunit d